MKAFQSGKLGKLPAVRFSFGPALVPVISICAVKAADGDEEDADQAAAKRVHRRGLQLAKTFPVSRKPPGRKSRTRSETASPAALPTFGKGRATGQPVALVVPERTEFGDRRLIEIGVFLPQQMASVPKQNIPCAPG